MTQPINSSTTTPPWVSFQSQSSTLINNFSQTIVSPSLSKRILDSLVITNRTPRSILYDIRVVRQSQPFVEGGLCLRHKEKLAPFSTLDVFQESCFYLNPGDFLVAHSSHMDDTFDTLASYREIMTSESISLSITSLTQDPQSLLVTGMTTLPQNLLDGTLIQISGAQPDAYNGFFTIIIPPNQTTTFQYQLSKLLPQATSGQAVLSYLAG